MMLRVVDAKDGIQNGELYIQATVIGNGNSSFGKSRISIRYRGKTLESIILQLRKTGIRIPFRTTLPPNENHYKLLARLMIGRIVDAPLSGG